MSPNTEALKLERDAFLYRCYIALGKYNMVLDSIKDDASVSVKLQVIYTLYVCRMLVNLFRSINLGSCNVLHPLLYRL